MRRLISTGIFLGVFWTISWGPVRLPGALEQGDEAGRLRITTPELPTGIVGTPYKAQLTASGGTPPYNWEIIGAALPVGLTLDNATGEITGTPTQFAKPTLVLRVNDSSQGKQEEATRPLMLVVNPDRLTIVSPGLPQAIIGQPYYFRLEVASGTPPYTWSILQGSLPSGLGLDPVSGAIQGTPTQYGTSVFIIQVTDSSSPPMSVATRIAPQPKAVTPPGYPLHFLLHYINPLSAHQLAGAVGENGR
jgi:hypothetical protein